MTEQSRFPPRPRILLTNDDGISSDTLWATYQALQRIGDVLVCAPATQQSAVGRSLSIFKPLRVHEVMMHDVVSYAVEGSPTDSVVIGLFALKWNPDLVVSGTNIGENLSCEAVTTSGTIGAALEAANHGVPAIAFSLQVLDQGAKFSDPRQQERKFDEVTTVVEDVVRRVMTQGFPSGVHVLNVNIPHIITGAYEVTTLAHKLFQTDVEMRHDPRGREYFWLTGPLIKEAPKGTDIYAVNQGNISITPLTIDCTARGREEAVLELFL
ncbi:MAG: 5'/3'-nucleotidase SurE [Methanomicrobiales archaeon]|jgi:5'-nucleotidase|nr:5'/3'-nucleotidase SurE [Methanomicrobiales archaeon]